MITTKTVFILGAGASKPYGYPTAHDLRTKIIDKYNDTFTQYLKQYYGEEAVYNNWLSKYQTYKEAFEKSSTQSIDLHISRNPKFRFIGKMIIIHQIFFAEKFSILREEMDYNDDWYSYIFTRMTDELQKPKQAWLGKNEVSFISFNYDRSFEHFLYESMRNSFLDVSEEDIFNAVNSIPILHVFGKVASLEWQQGKTNLSYKEIDPYNYESRNFVDNISTINENETIEIIDNIGKLIQHADRIFFLGFGYLDENLKLLGFPDIINPNQIIRGTGIGYTERERLGIRNKYFNRIKDIDNNAIICEMNSKDLLREYL